MDGNLRKILTKSLPEAQWTPIETGTTAQGVPDAEYCFPGGAQGMVECKKTLGWAVVVRPEQVGWLLRRSRLGGRCWVAVRRMGLGRDELWLVPGAQAATLKAQGLKGCAAALRCEGGPAKWDWAAVRSVLTSPPAQQS